ncbi:MAG: rhodanese-like domain-containing protein [Chitinophagaceae bacterium]|jgi:rhodanese-related sulfurtransferase|nr:rhodanese-like domain-containing protein [Chitinophagaceae bacterium]
MTKFVLIALLAMLATGCASTNEAGNKLLNEKQTARRLQQSKYALLDVRTRQEYDSAHMPDAILIDYKADSFVTSLSQLDKSKKWIVYCRSGKRSDGAASKMKAAGFKKVFQLSGGMYQWHGKKIKP